MNCCRCFFGVALISLLAASTNGNRTEIDSTAKRFAKILSRKRRFLLFPPGSAIVATLSYTKTLVPRSPSGINLLGECDIFYPLQTKISEWYPPTKKPPAPAAEYDDDGGGADNANGDMINSIMQNPIQSTLPPSFLPAPNPIATFGNGPIGPPPLPPPLPPLPPLPPPNNNPIESANGVLTSDPNFNIGKHPGEIYVRNDKLSITRDPLIRNIQNKNFGNYSGSTGARNVPKRLNEFGQFDANANHGWHPSKSMAQRRTDTHNSKRFPLSTRSGEQAEHFRWQRKRRAREQRDLYEQLASLPMLAHIDTKSCILRIICEAKHYLLPPGTSLFQDIVRILFTVPSDADDAGDDYNRAMESEEFHCRTEYTKKCPFSVLGYLLSADRPIL